MIKYLFITLILGYRTLIFNISLNPKTLSHFKLFIIHLAIYITGFPGIC